MERLLTLEVKFFIFVVYLISAFALSISFHDNSIFLIGMNVLKNFKTIDEIIARNIFPDRFANLSNSKEPFSTGFPILRKLVIGATS